MANELTYQSVFTGQEMDERFTAVAQLQAALLEVETALSAKYVKPASGIPETDLDSAVQSALAKARSAVQDLSNYYTKTEIDSLLAAVNSQEYVDVATLPTASASTLGKIYLVGPTDNQYDRYYTSYDGSDYSWVAAGSTEINLSNYATKAELNQLDQEKQELIPGLESEERSGEESYQSFTNDEETEEYVRISEEGIRAKDFLYKDGASDTSLVPIKRSGTVSTSAPFANIYSLIKPFEGKEITIRVTSASMLGKYQIIFTVNNDTVYGSRNVYKGYWAQMRVPNGISDARAYVNYADESVDVEIEELKYNEFRHITVGKSDSNIDGVSCDFSTVLEGCMAASKYRHSLVEIMPGEYNLEDEFPSVYGVGFFTNWAANDDHSQMLYPAGILLMNTAHYKFSPDSVVKFLYNGANSAVRGAFSPFRTGVKGFTLEGLTLKSSNCRYAIHDERSSDGDFYKNYYIGCNLTHDNSDPMNGGLYYQIIGGGLGVNGLVVVDGCYIDSVAYENSAGGAISWHNSSDANAKSHLIIKDNYIARKGTFRLSYYGTSTKVTEALVSGNNLGAEPILNAEASATVVNCDIIAWNNNIR